jgi:hypothetical protein
MMAADNTDPERSRWLKKHCKPVFTVGADGGEGPQDDKDGQGSQDTQDGGDGMGGMGGQTLHECMNA